MADCVTDIISGPKHGVVFYPGAIGYSIESNQGKSEYGDQ
jgi:hypothetical protein